MTPNESLEVRADGAILARCSLWWTSTPKLNGRRVGYIGQYARSDARAANELLTKAREALASAGCDFAVGPVDGSTWQRYRFVTERGDRPAFFLEPDNPGEYPADFREAGFAPLAHYVSAEETQLDYHDPRAARAALRLRGIGVTVRPFDLQRYAEELDAIYAVASRGFADALLFTPVSREMFQAIYAPLRAHIDPDFIRVAEHEGRPVGFAFGICDYSALDRNEPLDTIVGKTQAHLPDLRYAGLGAVMLEDVRRAAHRRGMRRIIHALIRDDNVALNGSRRVASVIRGYTLYESALA